MNDKRGDGYVNYLDLVIPHCTYISRQQIIPHKCTELFVHLIINKI